MGMSLQVKWKYPQITVPGVVSMMVFIEDSLREAFLPALFGGEEVSADLREILGHSVKHECLGLTDPWLSVERVYNTSKAAIEVLLGSLLGGTYLNYVAHKGCIGRASAGGRKQRELAEKAVISRRKEQADEAGLNFLRQATENGAWLTAIPHQLNGTEFSWD